MCWQSCKNMHMNELECVIMNNKQNNLLYFPIFNTLQYN